MIGKQEFMLAALDADQASREKSLDQVFAEKGIDIHAVKAAAEERALRLVVKIRGNGDFEALQLAMRTSQPYDIMLSYRERELLELFKMMWLDACITTRNLTE